jgi:light-regulated signal transduction histidine kinase (bacteriophytochrome)
MLDQIDINSCPMPIIMLTGYGDYDVDVKAMKAGAEDYLDKDQINAPLLERTIRYTVDRGKSRKALDAAYREMEQRVLDRTAELAEANSRLRKSSDEIKRFAYSVSHDLKSPMVAIHGLSRRLLQNCSNTLDEKSRQYCKQILAATEQIVSLVENINTYISTKERPINFQEFHLLEICRIVYAEFENRFKVRAIHWGVPEGDPLIRADKISMVRVLRNLVDNAMKYGGKKMSTISVNYKDAGDSHVISVIDDGVGLMEQSSERIFGLFFREKPIESIEGTGMGLAIVKEIAEQHEGNVWATSGQDKGLTISLSISKALK